MHEQSETVERDGKFYNVYGAATPNAGKVLPGTPAYNTLKEAVTAAKNRSGQYGREHNQEGNNMAEKLTVAQQEALDNVRDDQLRKKEADASTTASGMGDGRLKFPSFPSISRDQRKAEAEDAQEARNNAAEKTLRKYRGVKEGLPAMLADEQTKPLKWYPRKRGTLGAEPQDFDESKPVTTEGKPYYADKEVQRYYAHDYAHDLKEEGKKRGGAIKKYAKGGSVSSRGDGIAQRGKTKGRFV